MHKHLSFILAAVLFSASFLQMSLAQDAPEAAPAATESPYQSPLQPRARSGDGRTTPTTRTTVAPTPDFTIHQETTYNRHGTYSPSNIALISNRRKNPEFVGFLQGMQAASLRANRQALNVAPLEAESLEDQVRALGDRGIEYFIVDSPNPEDARLFIENTRVIGLNTLLIAEKQPRGFNPGPMVLNFPYYSEVVAETAIRHIGDKPVHVGYVVGDVDEEQREIAIEHFKRPFNQVAKSIRLVEIDPSTYQGGFEKLEAVCVLTREASARIANEARRRFPDAFIILCGESPNVLLGIEEGRFDVRVRPDYNSIYTLGMRELAARSDFPPMPRPVADRAPESSQPRP